MVNWLWRSILQKRVGSKVLRITTQEDVGVFLEERKLRVIIIYSSSVTTPIAKDPVYKTWGRINVFTVRNGVVICNREKTQRNLSGCLFYTDSC